MKYITIQADDCPEAWYKVLSVIWENVDSFEVRYGTKHALKKINLSLEIVHPEKRPLVADKAPIDMIYVQDYTFRRIWSRDIDNDSCTVSSRLRRPVDQIEFAIGRYLEEKRDRQITLIIRLPADIEKKTTGKKYESPYLSLIDTEIFDNEMNLTCYYRSWNAYTDLPGDIAAIQLFNEEFVKELNQRGNMNLKTGKLIFHSKDCYISSKQYKLVTEILCP